MIQKFRKKPVEVEAIQWNGNTNRAEIVAFVGKELNTELESETAYLAGVAPPIFSLLIETKEGVMTNISDLIFIETGYNKSKANRLSGQ